MPFKQHQNSREEVDLASAVKSRGLSMRSACVAQVRANLPRLVEAVRNSGQVIIFLPQSLSPSTGIGFHMTAVPGLSSVRPAPGCGLV